MREERVCFLSKEGCEPAAVSTTYLKADAALKEKGSVPASRPAHRLRVGAPHPSATPQRATGPTASSGDGGPERGGNRPKVAHPAVLPHGERPLLPHTGSNPSSVTTATLVASPSTCSSA